MSNLKPIEYECEKASQSYLMSLVSIIIGLPLPIVNLFATFLFLLLNRGESFFVRWHCWQALVSQLILFFLNSSLFWWTVSILFTDEVLSIKYFIYLGVILIINIIEIITTIYAAIEVRKGNDFRITPFCKLADIICKKDPDTF
jgi:hypothetical protein